MCYLITVKPYKNPFDNKMELFNEAMVFFVCSFSQCFFATYTDDGMENDFKNITQYVVLTLIAGTLFINCLIMICHMLRDVFDLFRSRLI